MSDLTGRPFILDTDIGTDVDDIFALVMLARSPTIDLIGVTTVYGDTTLRGRMARYVVDQLGMTDIDIVLGERTTLSDRPVFWAGHEGDGIPALSDVQVASEHQAVEYLIRQSKRFDGRLEIVAIGPLTNIARAIETDPQFASRIRRLYLMGGAFDRDQPEHNVKCDPEAAAIVFAAGMPTMVAGLDVTTQILWGLTERAQIAESNGELGPVLADQLDRWWDFIKQQQNHPHDPIAVLMATHPELYTLQRGRVSVRLDDDTLAQTVFHEDLAGTVQIATELNAEGVSNALLAALGARA